jgi:hypothetical protein
VYAPFLALVWCFTRVFVKAPSPSLKTIVHTVWNRIESQRVTHGSFDACI